MSRQVVYDKTTHGVEVVVSSRTQNALIGTVRTIQANIEIRHYCRWPRPSMAGLRTLTMNGEISGTDIPFLRVSEHIGERAIDFVDRLAKWRNLIWSTTAKATLSRRAAAARPAA